MSYAANVPSVLQSAVAAVFLAVVVASFSTLFPFVLVQMLYLLPSLLHDDDSINMVKGELNKLQMKKLLEMVLNEQEVAERE